MDFVDTPAGKEFWSDTERRQTALQLLYAIAMVAMDGDEAEAIWTNGLIPGRDAQTSLEHLYLNATRNFPIDAEKLIWRGDAAWAVTVRARLLTGVPMARWPGR